MNEGPPPDVLSFMATGACRLRWTDAAPREALEGGNDDDDERPVRARGASLCQSGRLPKLGVVGSFDGFYTVSLYEYSFINSTLEESTVLLFHFEIFTPSIIL